ncbi:hypothetical protein MXB_3985, partial [Myxobolus squamalis]
GLLHPVNNFEGAVCTDSAFYASSNLTIPYVWCLITGKNQHIYCEILHNIFRMLNYDWIPRVCVVDFEMVLFKSEKYQNAEITNIGCNFNLQQALLRKMQKSRIPAAEHTSYMQFIDGWSSAILGERYNRHLNEQFAIAHQKLFAFIAGTQKDEFDYTMQAKNICLVGYCSNLMALALKADFFKWIYNL